MIRNSTLLAALTPGASRPAAGALRLGGDGRWLAVLSASIAVESIWWAIAWMAGIAPPPFLLIYLTLSFTGLATAFAVRMLLRPEAETASRTSLILGTALVGLGASFFLPLKFAIPAEIPFWLDTPLAQAERFAFGVDPWLLFDRVLGWATVPIDRLYGTWLPVQSLVLFTLMLEPPSPAKSRALVAYSLAWFVLGVAAAALFSSAGPIFYDRLFGGREFALLGDTLRSRGAWIAIAESDTMWSAMTNDRPGLVAGISAMPSLHVAITFWIFLAARTMTPRLAWVALVYFAFIWLASVQLGWHYFSDGLFGALGMLGIWWIVGAFERRWGTMPAAELQGSVTHP